jgi:hypothetical protein
MIQIIGFLLCACLAVKLCEMSANSALRDENGKARDGLTSGLILGWLSVGGFFFWLLAQGGAFPEPIKPSGAYQPALTDEQIDCITNAETNEAVLACTP